MTHSKNVSGYSDRASSGPNRLSGSLLANLYRRAISSWQAWRSRRALERAIPAFHEACEQERKALRRGCTQALHKARLAKAQAVRMSLAGNNPRVRVVNGGR